MSRRTDLLRKREGGREGGRKKGRSRKEGGKKREGWKEGGREERRKEKREGGRKGAKSYRHRRLIDLSADQLLMTVQLLVTVCKEDGHLVVIKCLENCGL